MWDDNGGVDKAMTPVQVLRECVMVRLD